jgi:eukaryotic-like serine/threonine-protein kinase
VGELEELRSGDPGRIGPYRLEKRLGAGGMGCVYLGRSAGGHRVAIKAIRPELADDPGFRARFAREVAAARKVNGIFTAPVVDADLEGPVPWLATAYIPGPSLAEAVARDGPLSPPSVLALAAGLAEGLRAIHLAGIVHRDLKPANVILAQDGPRLIDFGISQAAGMVALTRTGTVLGSPGFMSPEQAAGHEVGPPSDIFSLGAVLAFAAAGHGPFGAGPTIELLFRVVNKDPDTHQLPAEVRPLVERCLVKDPLRRPTAAQLLTELSATPPAAAWSEPAAAGRKRAAAAQDRNSYQALEPTATVTPAVTPWRPADPVPGVPPTTRPRRSHRWPWMLGFVTSVLVAAAAVFAVWRAGYLDGTPGSRPPGAVTMTALASYLAQSAAVRPSVQPAIDGVRSCAQSPATGQAAIQRAIDAREHIVAQLQGLSPAGLPHGAQLISALADAMRSSASADQSYQDWMADFAVAGSPCGSDPTRNPDFAAGQEASAQATAGKAAFLRIWNPLAPRYGQRTYSAGDF